MRRPRLKRMVGLSLLVPVWAGCASSATPTYDLARYPGCRIRDDEIDARRGAVAERVEASVATVPVTTPGWYGPAGVLPDYPAGDRTGGLAVVSYPDQEPPLAGRTYLYDQALALLWHAWAGAPDTATGLARTLVALQRDDGSFGFSFDAASGFYDERYIRNGAVAWAAYALTYYAVTRGDADAMAAGRRAARYLADARRPDGLVPAGNGAWLDDGRLFVDDPVDVAVAEHQFDAHMAMSAALPAPTAGELEGAVVHGLWRDDHFRTAAGGAPAPDALDAAGGWGALWLLSVGRHREALESLRYTVANFYMRGDGIEGFRPYDEGPEGPGLPVDLVFVEGSMGAGLAALRAGVPALARRMIRLGMELGCMTGAGLPYANRSAPAFPATPAAAPSLWFLFLEREERTGRPAPLFPPTDLSARPVHPPVATTGAADETDATTHPAHAERSKP